MEAHIAATDPLVIDGSSQVLIAAYHHGGVPTLVRCLDVNDGLETPTASALFSTPDPQGLSQSEGAFGAEIVGRSRGQSGGHLLVAHAQVVGIHLGIG